MLDSGVVVAVVALAEWLEEMVLTARRAQVALQAALVMEATVVTVVAVVWPIQLRLVMAA